ncbi:MAG: type II toxin-antitoxin system PemK/MazF family toxin [bacterium]
MEILFGNIYLVNFDPSIGKEYRKVRPALVIQSNEITQNSPLVTVMPISTNVEKPGQDDILLSKDERNRLLHDSVLKTRQISSFDKHRFMHRIGEVSPEVLQLLQGYLRKHFCL